MLTFPRSSPRSHLAQLARIALLVAVVDVVTKEAAARWLSGRVMHAEGWLRFAVVHNKQGAFGLSLGAYTWQLNLALTLAAVALMLPVAQDLTRVDPRAPRGLGLIVGGALGNLTSLVASPNGVVDFIAVRYAPSALIVLNVADIAAYVGLAMILRTGYLIVLQLRANLDARPQVAVSPPLRLQPTALFADREVTPRVDPVTADRVVPSPGVVERPASHRPPVAERVRRDVDGRVFDLSQRLEQRDRLGDH